MDEETRQVHFLFGMALLICVCFVVGSFFVTPPVQVYMYVGSGTVSEAIPVSVPAEAEEPASIPGGEGVTEEPAPGSDAGEDMTEEPVADSGEDNGVAEEPAPDPDENNGVAEEPAAASKNETVSKEPAASSKSSGIVNGFVNINTATAAELQTLPGIGPVLSQAIIDYRTEHGPFSYVEELINVSGIGDKRLAAIIDYIVVQ